MLAIKDTIMSPKQTLVLLSWSFQLGGDTKGAQTHVTANLDIAMCIQRAMRE